MIASSASPLDDDRRRVLPLLVVQVRAEQQPAHADDRVHRRADLVAHRRQERALRLVRRVGAPPRLLQLAHVVVDPVEALVIAVDDERHDVDLDLDEAPVGAHPSGQPVRAALLQRLADDRLALIRVLGRLDHERVDRAADRVLRRVPEQALGRRVPAGHHLVPIHRDDRDRADVDERLEVLLLPADLRNRRAVSIAIAACCERPTRKLRSLAVNGSASGGIRQIAIIPITRPRARRGAAINRSSSSSGDRGSGPSRGSLIRSFTNSATPRLARSPIMPSPSRITSAMISSARLPSATSGTYRSAARSSRGRRRSCPLAAGPSRVPRSAGAPHRGRAVRRSPDSSSARVAISRASPPRLLEQARVLERDGQAPGEGGQQTHVVVAERVLTIQVLERDHADPAIADQQRHEDRRLRRFAHQDGGLSDRRGGILDVLVDHHGLAGLERHLRGTPSPRSDRAGYRTPRSIV